MLNYKNKKCEIVSTKYVCLCVKLLQNKSSNELKKQVMDASFDQGIALLRLINALTSKRQCLQSLNCINYAKQILKIKWKLSCNIISTRYVFLCVKLLRNESSNEFNKQAMEPKKGACIICSNFTFWLVCLKSFCIAYSSKFDKNC